MSEFVDSYFVWFKFEDEHGNVYEETHENMSISDFEVLYGTKTDLILELQLTLMVGESK